MLIEPQSSGHANELMESAQRRESELSDHIAEQREQALREQIQSVLVLRDHQIEAVSKCLAANHIINLPTGKGKTLVAVKVIDYFLQRHPAKNVVFVVYAHFTSLTVLNVLPNTYNTFQSFSNGNTR